MSHLLFRLGRASARRPFVVLAVWLLAAAAVIGSSSAWGEELEDSFAVPGLDSQAAVDLLSEAGDDSAGLTARVVATPSDGGSFTDTPAAMTALDELRAELAGLEHVLDAAEPTLTDDGELALILLQYPVVEDLRLDDLDQLKAVQAGIGAEAPIAVEMGGDLFFAFEEPQTGLGEMIGIAAAVIILLVAFGSVIAMGLPIGMALFGLALGISAMPLISFAIDIPSWAPTMGSMIGLGVGIDYALFLVTRHREFLAEGHPPHEAAGRAVATSGQAIIFAGGTVVIAILGMAVAGIPFMTAAGVSTSFIVLVMVLGSLTLLPAFLGLAGVRVNGLRQRRRDRNAASGPSEGWQRWGNHVATHAWPYALGVTALLIALTAPVLWLRVGFADEGALPDSRTERRAYDMVAEGYGPGINGPLLVAVDVGDDDGSLSALAAAIDADPGIASVADPELDVEAGVGTIVAIPATSPQDDETLTTIERLRAEVIPTALAGTDARAHVGGQTASWADIGNRVNDRLPYFITAVIVLSFLLLTVVFRSVVVALKAALLNLLSIGAAYGVLVVVFQWGWGMGLFGLESTLPIVPFLPMFMFAVLFGLSMDYEVFLLSRVREEYLATGDNDAAVIGGIASTARVITSAALIMISVFLGFVLGDDPTMKMMGLGLATAIFVDATIVRIVLVPATMKLMGDANWWLPGWLDRRLPVIDVEGGRSLEPAMARDSAGPTAQQSEAALGAELVEVT